MVTQAFAAMQVEDEEMADVNGDVAVGDEDDYDDK